MFSQRPPLQSVDRAEQPVVAAAVTAAVHVGLVAVTHLIVAGGCLACPVEAEPAEAVGSGVAAAAGVAPRARPAAIDPGLVAVAYGVQVGAWHTVGADAVKQRWSMQPPPSPQPP